jgi:hypothetical protein
MILVGDGWVMPKLARLTPRAAQRQKVMPTKIHWAAEVEAYKKRRSADARSWRSKSVRTRTAPRHGTIIAKANSRRTRSHGIAKVIGSDESIICGARQAPVDMSAEIDISYRAHSTFGLIPHSGSFHIRVHYTFVRIRCSGQTI